MLMVLVGKRAEWNGWAMIPNLSSASAVYYLLYYHPLYHSLLDTHAIRLAVK